MAVLAFGLKLSAQICEHKNQQLDSLFLSWNQPNHPGGAIGIMQNGKVVYSKAFGLANLEYLVPNSPGTRFNIASVSKQFTSMGIVLLHLEGKLSLDDDIRKHLPEVPDFGPTITIRHLVHHTSGLRSLHGLLALAGWRGDDTRTNADLLRLMERQEDLNFPPGNEYLYCNTGYMFMADIIQRVTGEKFASWMREHVFLPLDMTETYVEDDYRRVVPHNASSYFGSQEQGFSRSIDYWAYVGSGNMHSTTGDLLQWLGNFYAPTAGWEDAFDLMLTRGILNKGDTLNYAFGINLGTFRSHYMIQHGGSIGGYRSMVRAFPNEALNLVVLTNFSSSNSGHLINRMSEIMLELEPMVSTTTTRIKPPKHHRLSKEELKSISGRYLSPELDTYYTLSVQGDTTLVASHVRHGPIPVRIISKDQLEADHPLRDIRLERDKKGRIRGMYVSNGRVRNLWLEKIKD